MKQFVKVLPVDGCCFNYICNFFPGMSNEKLKARVLKGPQIRKIMRDPGFVESMTLVESAASISFSLVVKNFLGNTKADNYKELLEDMLFNFKNLGVKMSIKIYYLLCHLGRFRQNLGHLSEEQRERFHQDIKVMKEDTKEGGIPICWPITVGIFSAMVLLPLTQKNLTKYDLFLLIDLLACNAFQL